jgi:hypothetical protein
MKLARGLREWIKSMPLFKRNVNPTLDGRGDRPVTNWALVNECTKRPSPAQVSMEWIKSMPLFQTGVYPLSDGEPENQGEVIDPLHIGNL